MNKKNKIWWHWNWRRRISSIFKTPISSIFKTPIWISDIERLQRFWKVRLLCIFCPQMLKYKKGLMKTDMFIF